MYNWVFYIIVFFVVGEYIFSQWLALRNRRAASPVLPEMLRGLYDERKYADQQNYFKVNNRFGLITSTYTTLLVLLMLFLGGFGWLDTWAFSLFEKLVPATLFFFFVLFLVNDLLTIPFDWYDTFVIEDRFGFNQTTRKTFVADKLKSWLFGIVIGGLLFAAILWLYLWLGTSFWWVACIVVVAFSMLMNMFYSEWIVPLFNKQTPLEEGELRNAIEKFANRAGFKLNNIYVIDGSKRSTKANAYFSGLGPKKRIVLYDTLIDDLSTEEIVAVLAHEIGHYKHKHTWQMMGVSVMNTVLMFFLLSLVLDSSVLAEAMGGSTPSFPLALVAFGLLYTPLELLTGIGINALSRRNEYQADAFAASFGLANALIGGLKKLSVKSLSNLTPDSLYVKVYYSHPTLLQRMAALQKYK